MASLAVGQGQFLSLHKQISSQMPKKPLKTRSWKTRLFSIKNLGISAAAGAIIHVAYKNRSLGGGGGAGGVGGSGGEGGGGGGGWARLPFLFREWDEHGLPADVIVKLKNLNRFKMYKISALEIVDLTHSVVLGSSDSFWEMVSLRAGGVYTKAQLLKELETLANCGSFEKIKLEAKTNVDGTIDLNVSFLKSTSTLERLDVGDIKPCSNIDTRSLFSYIQLKNEGGSIVKMKLKEAQNNSAVVTIHPGRNGPSSSLPLIPPGGTVSLLHGNLNIKGTVTTSNLGNPQEDVSFNLEYVRCLDSRNRSLHTSCFNSRKLSPVFTRLVPVWVDRAGIKTTFTEMVTPIIKFTYGIVIEKVTTRDRSSVITSNGPRLLVDGGISADGPPTSLSGTGVDRMVYAQASITSDNTKLVNGQLVGNRNVILMNQGVGIGSKFFNRHEITMTRFIQLKEVEKGPPPVLILQSHCGGCVGDLPNYNAFTLGGPYSVRGYNLGEIGAARYIHELAAEIRLPLRNTQLYGFVEHGSDLGSSRDLRGNPTKVYGRRGQGSSYGVGAKLGLVSVEYVVKHTSGIHAIFFGYGERF